MIRRVDRFDEQKSFETVVIDAFAEPSTTRKPVGLMSELVSDENTIDTPSRHQTGVVVSEKNRRQLSEVFVLRVEKRKRTVCRWTRTMSNVYFELGLERTLRRQRNDLG